MKKISLIIVLITTCMLTACSFIPKRSNAETAEKYAQKYINEQVSLSDKKIESQKDSYQMRTIYHLKDDRNIEFNVMVDDNYISFVEASIPNIYTNYTIFSSDYKARVMDYYFEDIDEIISGLKLEKDYIKPANYAYLSVFVSEEETMENIAEVIMKIDSLLAYDIELPSEVTSEMLDKNISWKNSCDGTIHIEMTDKDGKSLLYLIFEFSDGNTHILTYEKVLRTLKAELMQSNSDEKILFVYLNDKLFYGIDNLYSEETKDDVAEYDGKMEKYNQMIPQKNGYGNVGAGIPYRFGLNGEVYVYMKDGCRQLYEFK